MPRAPQFTFPDLIWSHFSRPRLGGFDERVAAASSAGMVGIGLYTTEYQRVIEQEGRTPDDVRALLDRYDMTIPDAEVARGWWATEGVAAEVSANVERWAFEMADEYGTNYLQVVGSYECGFDQAADQLGQLADRAAAHGMRLGIEWLPFTNIETPADAQALVRAVARPNVGYCVDIWHHRRGLNDPAAIEALEPDLVFSIQLSDGTMEPAETDYKADCLANRVVPGDGEFEVADFLAGLIGRGVDAPLALEVCSAALWAGDPVVAANSAADAMRRVLVDAGLVA